MRAKRVLGWRIFPSTHISAIWNTSRLAFPIHTTLGCIVATAPVAAGFVNFAYIVLQSIFTALMSSAVVALAITAGFVNFADIRGLRILTALVSPGVVAFAIAAGLVRVVVAKTTVPPVPAIFTFLTCIRVAAVSLAAVFAFETVCVAVALAVTIFTFFIFAERLAFAVHACFTVACAAVIDTTFAVPRLTGWTGMRIRHTLNGKNARQQ